MHIVNQTVDISNIRQHTHLSNRNPMPSKAQIGDYYERDNSWSRRYVTEITNKECAYKCYQILDYIIDRENGSMIGGYYSYIDYGYCSLAHMKNWSNK